MKNQTSLPPACYICHERHRSWHSHHVVMRSKTGEAGPQVPLCGSCHTLLHTVALARVTKSRGGRANPNNLEWSYSRHPEEHANAERLIAPLVQIMLMTDGHDLPKVTSLELPKVINDGLMRLKQDLGLNNKPATILYCCSVVLSARGLLGIGTTKRKGMK